jgi:arylsulfatase A-like enzyme
MGLPGDATGGFDLYDTEKHAARLFADAGYESALCGFEHESRDCKKLGFEKTMAGSGDWHNGGGDLRDYHKILDAWFAKRDKSRPFYLQIGCHETHHPWTKADVQPDKEKGLWIPPYLKDISDTRHEVAEFQGAVRRLDHCLGKILEVFDQRGLAENTIFVFTTDHGIDFPRAKGTFYDPGIEVFLFMRWPGGGWKPGRVVEEMVSNVDVLPTLLDACDIPKPDNLQGRSFLPLIQGGDYRPNDRVFAEKTYHDTYDPTRAVRTAKHKYIRYFETCIFQDLRLAVETRRHFFADDWRRKSVEELYDLEADPWEKNNLADQPEMAGIKAELRRSLLEWMRQTDDPLLKGMVPSPRYQNELAEFLKS